MKKFYGAFALAATALTAMPAYGQDLTPPEELVITEGTPGEPRISVPGEDTVIENPSGWYVGGEFGAMIVEDTNVDIGAVDNALRLNYDYGYDGGLFVGYDLGAFRIEAEVAYKKADLDSFNTVIRLPGEGIVFPPSREFAGGNVSALSFMLNGMLDFGDDEGISGFVGGGIGMARVKANNQRVFANTAPFLDDSDSKLAWQVFAGVRQAISDNIDVTVKYRFFNVDDVRMVAFNGNESEHRFRSHSLLGGITFRFGGKKIIPGEPKCVPGGQMDPLDLVCPDIPGTLGTRMKRCYPGGETVPLDYECRRGPFIVFFDWEKSDLTTEAVQILDNAASTYAATGNAQVLIDGHADTSGGPEFNLKLSLARALAVQNYLVGRGLPSGAVEAFGESCPRVESGDNVREPQNRRVEVYYGGRTAAAKCQTKPY